MEEEIGKWRFWHVMQKVGYVRGRDLETVMTETYFHFFFLEVKTATYTMYSNALKYFVDHPHI